MGRIIFKRKIKKALNQLYSRVSQNVQFESMVNTTLWFIGTGAIGPLVEQLVRLFIRRAYLFDNKLVQRKNMVAQNFVNSDVGTPKPQALKKRLIESQLEKDNPNIPPLEVFTYGDFLAVSDKEIKQIILKEKSEGRRVIFIMASDCHPVQARGNRIAIKYDVPVFWVGIYRMGKAGEIVFYVPGYDLPCYRCITESRYNFFDKNRLNDHLRGNGTGAGRSVGLPSAANFIDSVLEHLLIGYIHHEIETNQHGKLFRRLLAEKRNFIQCQIDPDYRLDDSEDIFSQIQGPDLIAFNTIFQKEQRSIECLDCNPVCIDWVWKNTDYTKENYQEKLKLFSGNVSSFLHGGVFIHPLLKEYESYFPIWEQALNSKAITKGIFEIIIERNNREAFRVSIGEGPIKKTIRNVKPGFYIFRSSSNSILWQGELEKHDLLWAEAFPEQPLKLAADTGEIFLNSTKTINLLGNKISIRVFPEIEFGRLELEIKDHDFA